LLLLDLVGFLLPGINLRIYLGAFLSRLACLMGGVLVGTITLLYQRHWHGACLACGTKVGAVRISSTPCWARVAAWAAVVGCLVRLLDQLAVGFGNALLEGGGAVIGFEAGFLLAGTVLPLALVYPWGRVFPHWVPWLAGHRVPRWLVLGPGLVLGVGMTAYFSVTVVRITQQMFAGTFDPGEYPLWFFAVAVPAYLVWGVGLAVAALAYQRVTRPACRICQSRT
jgi:hypothetical protein